MCSNTPPPSLRTVHRWSGMELNIAECDEVMQSNTCDRSRWKWFRMRWSSSSNALVRYGRHICEAVSRPIMSSCCSECAGKGFGWYGVSTLPCPGNKAFTCESISPRSQSAMLIVYFLYSNGGSSTKVWEKGSSSIS